MQTVTSNITSCPLELVYKFNAQQIESEKHVIIGRSTLLTGTSASLQAVPPEPVDSTALFAVAAAHAHPQDIELHYANLRLAKKPIYWNSYPKIGNVGSHTYLCCTNPENRVCNYFMFLVTSTEQTAEVLTFSAVLDKCIFDQPFSLGKASLPYRRPVTRLELGVASGAFCAQNSPSFCTNSTSSTTDHLCSFPSAASTIEPSDQHFFTQSANRIRSDNAVWSMGLLPHATSSIRNPNEYMSDCACCLARVRQFGCHVPQRAHNVGREGVLPVVIKSSEPEVAQFHVRVGIERDVARLHVPTYDHLFPLFVQVKQLESYAFHDLECRSQFKMSPLFASKNEFIDQEEIIFSLAPSMQMHLFKQLDIN
ncbi:hypothetical protein ACJRO7_008573 [Eucalyptus globulus]|uniref:Uncharacterized protein n=1 Tax=Eucalyptus globulus TaxID=34317 RepID=A0ABD3IS04_EUCGL